MKCIALFIIFAFVVAVKSSPAVHRVTGKFVTHVHREEGGGGGGDGNLHVHRVRGGGGGGDGSLNVHKIEGGGGDGGEHVHRIKGKPVTHVHKIEGSGGAPGADLSVGGAPGADLSVGGAPGAGVDLSAGGAPGAGVDLSAGANLGAGGAPGAGGNPSAPYGPGGAPGAGSGIRGAGGIPFPAKAGGPGGPKTRCQKGLIDGTASALDIAFKKITHGIGNVVGADAPHPNLIGHLIGGVETALDRVANGAKQAVSDFFCGFNTVFNVIGDGLGEGKLGKAVFGGLDAFATGADKFFGNIASNIVGAVGSGIDDLYKGRRGHGE